MPTVILFLTPNPKITQDMIDLYHQKANVNPKYDPVATANILMRREFLRHDQIMAEVIKELKCPDFKLVELTDKEWRYYHIEDEKIIKR